MPLGGTDSTVVGGGVTFITGPGEKLVISGQVNINQQSGSPSSGDVSLYVDGAPVLFSTVLIQPAPGSGEGQSFTVLAETAALSAASHTVDLQAACAALGARTVNAQLQVLRVLA